MILVDADDDQLVAFHRGIYWDAFAAQHEPLSVWQAARRGELPYQLVVRLALDDDGIAGGIAFERYPKSGCGLVTYMVVAPRVRGQGVGKRLLDDALATLATTVFGEVNDPRTQQREPAAVAWERLRRFERWGARVVDVPYVQPALAPGLQRDTTLLLLAFTDYTRAEVDAFVAELYEVTEGR